MRRSNIMQGMFNDLTIQNWYRGDQTGEGGLYKFTTKGPCLRDEETTTPVITMFHGRPTV